MSKKWISPLEKMMASENTQISTVAEVTEKILSENIANTLKTGEKNIRNLEIIEISPDDCIKWKYKDRPENELGDIEELSENLKKNGQIHPVIVRTINNVKNQSEKKYELIAGERRWLAAKKAQIKLLAIVKDVSDYDAALIQASENDKRKDLSDYAKGIMLQQQIDDGILTVKDLEAKLSRSQSYIRNLLSFSRLDKEVVSAIGDMRHISSRTVYDLVRWQEKGEQYKKAIISISPLLRTGKIGEKSLEKHLTNAVSGDTRKKDFKEVLTRDGRHVFSWRNDTNKNTSISFPKNIRKFLDFSELEKTIVTHIEEQLKKKTASKEVA